MDIYDFALATEGDCEVAYFKVYDLRRGNGSLVKRPVAMVITAPRGHVVIFQPEPASGYDVTNERVTDVQCAGIRAFMEQQRR